MCSLQQEQKRSITTSSSPARTSLAIHDPFHDDRQSAECERKRTPDDRFTEEIVQKSQSDSEPHATTPDTQKPSREFVGPMIDTRFLVKFHTHQRPELQEHIPRTVITRSGDEA